MTIRLQNLSCGFLPDPPVLTGVSVQFPDRSLTAIIGPNGAGKSTLLRTMLGLVPALGGEVFLGDRRLHTMSARDRAARVAYLPQEGSVVFPFTVREVVRLGRFASGLNPADAPVQEAMVAAGVMDRADDPFSVLSAGQRQRVVVARAIAQLAGTHPASTAILADEPVAAMDPANAIRTMNLLREHSRRGAAVIVVLHDLHLVASFADAVLTINQGGHASAIVPAAAALDPAVLETVFGTPFRAVRDDAWPESPPVVVPAVGPVP
ncbi:MAG: ABC transporter ATP-binding protein [Planctomycetes bacterium]|nr:ABC transporter ATP-binding protein [Planctomycetota bacterium]